MSNLGDKCHKKIISFLYFNAIECSSLQLSLFLNILYGFIKTVIGNTILHSEFVSAC